MVLGATSKEKRVKGSIRPVSLDNNGGLRKEKKKGLAVGEGSGAEHHPLRKEQRKGMKARQERRGQPEKERKAMH